MADVRSSLLLFAISCMLAVARCLLLFVVLSGVCFVMFGGVDCVLFVVRWSWCAVCCLVVVRCYL